MDECVLDVTRSRLIWTSVCVCDVRRFRRTMLQEVGRDGQERVLDVTRRLRWTRVCCKLQEEGSDGQESVLDVTRRRLRWTRVCCKLQEEG